MAKKQPAKIPLPYVKTSKNTAEKATDELAKSTIELKTEYESQRQEQQTLCEKALQAYEMRAPARKFEWQSNAYIGIMYRDLRTILPRVKKQVVGAIPLLKYVGGSNEVEEKYVSSALRKCDGYLELSDTCFEACLYGTAWGRTWWDYEAQKVMVKVPDKPKASDILKRIEMAKAGQEFPEKMVEKERVIEIVNQPVYRHIPWWNIYCNCLETDDLDEATIIEIRNTNIEWLKARSKDKGLNPNGFEFGMYDNVGLVAAVEHMRQESDPEETLRHVREEVTPTESLRKDNITLMIRQGDFTHQGQFYKNGMATVAMVNSKDGKRHYITLRVMKCPRSDGRKSYHSMRYERVPGRMYGRSIYDAIARMQDNVNDLARAAVDKDTIYLHRPIAFDVGRVSDPELLNVRMGGMMPVLGPPGEIIRELQFEPAGYDAWRIIEMLTNWSMAQSGAQDPMAGESPKGQRTATGVSILTRGALERVQDTCRDMCEEFIAGKNGIGQAFHCLIKDHFKEHKDKIKFSYVNNKGEVEAQELNPADISGEVDVYAPSLFERIDREDMSNTMFSLLQFGGSLMTKENLMKYLQKIAEYKEIPGYQELFREPEMDSIPMDVIQAVMQMLGIDPGMFGAALNQLSMGDQGQGGAPAAGGNGGGGGPKMAARTPPSQVQNKGQGTAQAPMPRIGANTGRMG